MFKNTIKFVLVFLLLWSFSFVGEVEFSSDAQAAFNAQINYQGKLTNSSNVAVADGTYNMEFKLYDALSNGNLLWTETRTGGNKVTVTNGVFSVMLGEVSSLSGVNFDQTVYLDVNIGGTGSPSWDGSMSPRKKIGAVPAAFVSSNLKGTGIIDLINTSTQASIGYDASNKITLGVASNGFTTFTASGSGAGFNLTGGNVGIGTSSLSAKLHVTATTEQMRMSYDASNYTSLTTSSAGDLTIAPSGGDLAITGNVDVSGTLTAGTGDAFAVGSTGIVTAGTWQGTTVGIAYGGTGATSSQGAINAISQLTTNGDLLYHNGTNSTRLARGSNGQCLTANATTLVWGSCGAGGSTTFDTIGDPTGTGAIAMANYAQSLDWATLTSEIGLTVTGGSAMTTGTALKIGTATFSHTTTETGQLVNLVVTDASTNTSGTATTNGLDIDVTINTTGAGSKQINALNISTPTLTGCASGACTFAGLRFTGGTGSLANLTSYGLYIDAGSGSGTEYAAAFMNGNVGIGTATPVSMLQVGAAANRGDISVYGDLKIIGADIQRSLSGIIDMFVYDTTRDADGGEWRDSLISQQMSWATEGKDDGIGDPCVIASDDRCGTSTFPRKAILVTTTDALYIFDSADNSLWMKFTQGGTYSLGPDANNNPSGVGAQNGVVVVGTNGSSGTGMYAIDFKQDVIYRYNTTNRTQADIDIGNRNSTATYADNAETGFAILNNLVNDVSIAMQTSSNEGSAGTLIAPIDSQGGPMRGVTIIAAANDSGVSVINMGTRKVINYSDVTNDDYNQVVMTTRGRMYATNETQAQLEEWKGVDTVSTSQANGTPGRVYDETIGKSPITTGTAPTISTSPSSLAVIERASSARESAAAGQIDSGDIIFVGTNQGLAEVHTSGGTLVGASWSKLTTTTVATPYMVGAVRGMFSFDDAAGSTFSNSAIGAGANNARLDQAGATAPTYGGGGVRGTGVNFNNNSYLCSDANDDGTCDADTIFNAGTIGFTVSLWFKHGTTAASDTLFERCYTPAIPTAAVGCIWAGMTSAGNIKIGLDSITTWTYETTYDDSVTSSATYNDNQWHHLVYTNTDTDICLYIDGRQAAACDTSLAATATLDASQVLTVGGACSGANCATGTNYWDGFIDDMVWSSNGGTTADGLTAQSANKLFLDGRAHMIRPSTTVVDATAFSATTLGDSGENYVPDSFVGLVVELTGGTGSGQTRTIISNTATTFTVYPAFTVTPDTTTDYQVSPAKLYGATNNVTAISVDAPTNLNRLRKVYIGTSDGADGGGVTVYTNAGSGSIKTEVIHASAGYPNDDLGTSWSDTGSDNITALASYSETMVLGTGSFIRMQRRDVTAKQIQTETINAFEDLRQTIVAAGLFGSTQDVLGLGQGADLAEYYYSTDTLDYGDVVVIDPSGNGDDVVRSTQKYSSGLVGIVATRPGIVLGHRAENGFPIALTGRVPVKLSYENGPVKAGDYLTSSSIPGYAMRATGAGPVIGKALSNSPSIEEAADCPSEELFSAITQKCASVLVFVEHGDYSGMDISELMKEMAISVTTDGALIEGSTAGLVEASTDLLSATGLAMASDEMSTDEKILVFLKYVKQTRQERGEGVSAQLFTDRVSVAFEIITPQVTTSGLKVEKIGKLGENLDMLSDVSFFGRPYFNTDTAGFALIRAGEQTVTINFEREYVDQPIVNTTITLDDVPQDADEATTAQLEQLERDILSGDLRYVVTKKSLKGFTIKLAQPALVNMQFSWTALAVKQPKIFSNEQSEKSISADTPANAPVFDNYGNPAGIPPYELIDSSSDEDKTTNNTSSAESSEILGLKSVPSSSFSENNITPSSPDIIE